MAINSRNGRTVLRERCLGLTVLVMVAMFANTSAAQNLSSGSIDGIVTDSTGGTLPGVLVTVTSPALQIQKRTETTDSGGHYQFIDLPRGTYELRFELSGFQPLVRQGLELSVGFAARVNVALSIGAVAETVTVSGASPVVDLTTTRGGATVSTTLLTTALPGNMTVSDLVQLTPGLTSQVNAGENPGVLGLNSRPRYAMYGLNSDNTNITMMIDGFLVIANNPIPDVGVTVETDVKTFGNGAEVKEVGAAMNMVVKSGGNDFHGEMTASTMHQPSTNLDDALRARGLAVGQQQQYFDDYGADLGGRIVRDKLWFFGSFRYRRSQTSQVGLLLNDGTPAFPQFWARNTAAKASYQPTPKYQLSGYATIRDHNVNQADIQIAPFGAAVNFASTPFNSTNPFDWQPDTAKVEFKGTPSSKLLFDIQFGRSGYLLDYGIQPAAIAAGIPNSYDLTTLLLTGTNIPHQSDYNMWVLDGNLTYVPNGFLGQRHDFKVGYHMALRDITSNRPNNPVCNCALEFDTVNGVPHQGVEFETNNAPVNPVQWDDVYSAYVTDQWRPGNRVTLNLGLRFDRQHSYVPAQSRVAGQFVPAASFPAVEVLSYNHLAPRAAIAWDVTGGGKTVFKTTYGWFNVENDIAATFNQNASYTTDYRWHDLNHDGLYEPGEVNLNTNGPDFLSTTNTSNSIINPNLKLPHVQEITTSVEHELAPHLGVRGLYLYRRFGDQSSTVNGLRPYSAFDIPLTRRDPGPDGILGTADDGTLVTVYDYEPAYRGSAFVGNEIVNYVDGRNDYYQAFEGAFDKRLAQNWSLLTSYTATKFHQWIIGVPQSPNDNYYPLDTAWRWSFKLNGSYEFPHDILVGSVLDLTNGPLGQRTYVFRATDPNGGPSLKQLATVTLRLEPPGSEQNPPVPVWNLRAAKRFRIGRQAFQVSLDALNVTNSNAIKAATYVSGPTFGKVTDIVPPRLLRFGVRYTF